jgi:hypothetical protein
MDAFRNIARKKEGDPTGTGLIPWLTGGIILI